MALKTSLDTDEIFKVAYLHHVEGVEQHVLSVAFSVNVGRIAEACIAMAYAAEHLRSIYNKAKAAKVLEPDLPLDEVDGPIRLPRVLQNGPLMRDPLVREG